VIEFLISGVPPKVHTFFHELQQQLPKSRKGKTEVKKKRETHCFNGWFELEF